MVIAAEWGSGRRAGSLSNLHLGARDRDGGFVMFGKVFKGMIDAILRWQTQGLQELATRREGHVVHVRPELVVEICLRRHPDQPVAHLGQALGVNSSAKRSAVCAPKRDVAYRHSSRGAFVLLRRDRRDDGDGRRGGAGAADRGTCTATSSWLATWACRT